MGRELIEESFFTSSLLGLLEEGMSRMDFNRVLKKCLYTLSTATGSERIVFNPLFFKG